MLILLVALISVDYDPPVQGLEEDHHNKPDLVLTLAPEPDPAIQAMLPANWTHLGHFEVGGEEIIRGTDAEQNISNVGFLWLSSVTFHTTGETYQADTLGVYGRLDDGSGHLEIAGDRIIVQAIDGSSDKAHIFLVPEPGTVWLLFLAGLVLAWRCLWPTRTSRRFMSS